MDNNTNFTEGIKPDEVNEPVYSDEYLFKDIEESVEPVQIQEKEEDPRTYLGLVALAMFFGAGIVGALTNYTRSIEMDSVIQFAESVMLIASFVLMIYVRIKYPKDVAAKVLMWIMIVGVVATIIMILVLIVACKTLCSGM